MSPGCCLFQVNKAWVKGAKGILVKSGMINTNKVNWRKIVTESKCSQPRLLEVLDL